jgi:hypothetical protein
VQLRGLEPQTPTLPGRLRGIHGGSPPFVSPGQEVWGRPRTATDDPERGSLATIVAPRGGRLIDALDRGPVRRSVPTAGTGLVWQRAVRLALAPKAPVLSRCRRSVSYPRRGTPVCSWSDQSAKPRTPRPSPTVEAPGGMAPTSRRSSPLGQFYDVAGHRSHVPRDIVHVWGVWPCSPAQLTPKRGQAHWCCSWLAPAWLT